jgi:integrase|tara:strand:+ start:115 stop:690 length:576 start_codon:yes stop_codon:yes gene_type:complete
MRGKRPLSERQVKSLRKLVEGNELHELLLNLSVDLMLRGGDLLRLRVSDVLTESGTVKSEVKIKQQKTKKTTLSIPLSKNSINVIKKYIVGRDMDDFVFRSQFSHFTNKPLSIFQYSRIVKKWMGEHLGLDDVSSFSTHSLRKTKSSVIYQKTQSVEIVRRLLGQSSVTATSAYLGIEDSDALEVARNINI